MRRQEMDLFYRQRNSPAPLNAMGSNFWHHRSFLITFILLCSVLSDLSLCVGMHDWWLTVNHWCKNLAGLVFVRGCWAKGDSFLLCFALPGAVLRGRYPCSEIPPLLGRGPRCRQLFPQHALLWLLHQELSRQLKLLHSRLASKFPSPSLLVPVRASCSGFYPSKVYISLGTEILPPLWGASSYL